MHWRDVIRDVEAQAEAADTAVIQRRAELHTRQSLAQRRSADRLMELRGCSLELRMTAGLIVRGRLCACGSDWVQLRDAEDGSGGIDILPMQAITSWRLVERDALSDRPEASAGSPSSPPVIPGAATPHQSPNLLQLLGTCSRDRLGVVLTVNGGATLRGQVVSAGADHVDIAGEHGTWVVPITQLVRITMQK